MLCRIFLVALLVRVLCAALVAHVNPYAQVVLVQDAGQYDRLAVNL